MKKRPIIGITSDRLMPSEKNSLTVPFFGLKENYLKAVQEAGGIPLILPYCIDDVNCLLNSLDGVLVSGGDFDMDPGLYNQTPLGDTGNLNPERTGFELALTREALERNMPLLGICGGEQVLNVAQGGTLFQDLPGQCGVYHEQKTPPSKPSHGITLTQDSKLSWIMRSRTLQVNSTHHQAVREPGIGLKVSARSEDGVIEAVESPHHRFVIGVQWHPEALGYPVWEKLFKEFVYQAGLPC
ncbi:MAG: gamma-glutamyl-gamma-aminobutyrate hydrolase family protein [bacterium]